MTFWNKILVLLPVFLDISGEYMNGNMKSKIKMGEARQDCDDGVNGNDIDWDGNPRNYTCYHPDTLLLGTSTRSVVECKDLPSDYSPQHFCLGTPIKYPHPVPHHGNHRPIWPKFGEYRFVPAQRWLHNIEHGAVVMLYHPCTHPILVQQLRDLLTGCIRKHIITPHNDLPEDKPLALVAWGCRLLMSSIKKDEVINFIRSKGLHGPEGKYSKEGQYTRDLIKLAEPPAGSDMDDSILCPNM